MTLSVSLFLPFFRFVLNSFSILLFFLCHFSHAITLWVPTESLSLSCLCLVVSTFDFLFPIYPFHPQILLLAVLISLRKREFFLLFLFPELFSVTHTLLANFNFIIWSYHSPITDTRILFLNSHFSTSPPANLIRTFQLFPSSHPWTFYSSLHGHCDEGHLECCCRHSSAILPSHDPWKCLTYWRCFSGNPVLSDSPTDWPSLVKFHLKHSLFLFSHFCQQISDCI